MRFRGSRVAFALVASLPPLAAAAGAAPIATTADAVGDAHGAPDLCAVAVSTGSATVTFRITFADRPSLEPGERVTVVLDSDRHRSTGNRWLGGADLLASYGTLGMRTFGGELVRWSRSRWAPVTDGNARFVPRKNALTVELDRSVLRGRGFAWSVVSFQAGKGRGMDAVPDRGTSTHLPNRGDGEEPSCGPPSRRA